MIGTPREIIKKADLSRKQGMSGVITLPLCFMSVLNLKIHQHMLFIDLFNSYLGLGFAGGGRAGSLPVFLDCSWQEVEECA